MNDIHRKTTHALNYLFHNRTQFCDSIVRTLGGWLPDKLYLSLRFRCRMGYWLNFKTPRTFSEKINWLKLYNRKPEYTQMVDKYAVKDYVAAKIGNEYIIPTIGVWETPELIEWDKLPNRFVLKTTHGGGNNGVVICRDKQMFDYKSAICKLSASLKSDIYRSYREWPYKNVKKQIIAEKYISPSTQSQTGNNEDLNDYKFFCFNGEPMYCQVIRDRNMKETIDFYDMEWHHQEFVGLNPVARNGLSPVARNGLSPVARPRQFEKMKEICRKLAKEMPFIRVDLYSVDNEIYFGELTFYPASGFGVFTPDNWNIKLGNLLKLPNG